MPRGVRKHLEMARLCREDFADAWPVAVAEALKCVDRRNGEHGGWRRALEATRPRWKSAYEREPAGRDELALSFCGEGRDESTEVCVQCGNPLPSKHAKRFCREQCRRQWWRVREVSRAAA